MPVNPATIAAAAAVVNTAGNLLGGGGGGGPGGERFQQQQLNLLQSLLTPGGIKMQGPLGTGFNLPSLEEFFGPLGVPQTGLQRQAVGGIQQFLNQPAPEQRAFDVSRPILEGMLTGTGPQFERDIARANIQGGRFSSANAILRGEALRNLFNQRTQTAQTLGLLAGQAGQAPFGRLLAAGQFGGQLAGQADIETQRRVQLLQGLLGTAQQVAFNQPVQQQPNFLQTLGQGGIDIATIMSLQSLFG